MTVDLFFSRVFVLVMGWWFAPIFALGGWFSDLSLEPPYRLGLRRNWQIACESFITNPWVTP